MHLLANCNPPPLPNGGGYCQTTGNRKIASIASVHDSEQFYPRHQDSIAECVRKHIVHALANVVATKLGLILLFGLSGVHAHKHCACAGGRSGH